MTLSHEQTLTLLEHAIEHVRQATNADNGNDQFDAAHILIEAHQAIGPNRAIPSWMITRIRRNAAITLEHAIARLGHYDAQGWLTCPENDTEAIHIIQNAKWTLEAMDSSASNRFWETERNKYNLMLVDNDIV